MKTFNELCALHGTDKGTTVRECHGYSFVYDEVFSHLRNEKIKMLEIGIADPLFPGASLRVLTDYFPNGTIYGFDIQHVDFKIDRTVIFQGDSSVREDVQKIIDHDETPFDIILDDGSHEHKHHMIHFDVLFPHLKSGGIYIIEDLHALDGRQTIDYFWNEENKAELKSKGITKAELSCHGKLLVLHKA